MNGKNIVIKLTGALLQEEQSLFSCSTNGAGQCKKNGNLNSNGIA